MQVPYNRARMWIRVCCSEHLMMTSASTVEICKHTEGRTLGYDLRIVYKGLFLSTAGRILIDF